MFLKTVFKNQFRKIFLYFEEQNSVWKLNSSKMEEEKKIMMIGGFRVRVRVRVT